MINMIKIAKKTYITISMIISFILFAQSGLIAENKKSDVCYLSFFYEDNTGNIKTIQFDDEHVSLQKDDKLKIFIQPLSELYFYLYQVDTDKRTYRIFPDDSNTYIERGSIVYIPRGEPATKSVQWIGLDGNGPDEFYFILSTRKLESLDTVTDEAASNHSQKEHGRLLSQLESLHEMAKDSDGKNSLFQSTKKHYSVISGTVRGTKFKIKKLKFRDVYVKKITITH